MPGTHIRYDDHASYVGTPHVTHPLHASSNLASMYKRKYTFYPNLYSKNSIIKFVLIKT